MLPTIYKKILISLLFSFILSRLIILWHLKSILQRKIKIKKARGFTPFLSSTKKKKNPSPFSFVASLYYLNLLIYIFLTWDGNDNKTVFLSFFAQDMSAMIEIFYKLNSQITLSRVVGNWFYIIYCLEHLHPWNY